MINYDLHWNPVRLMQRIGRVDRRLNPQVEERLVADHPDQRPLRGNIIYWNFLPPEELNELLTLYKRVTQKTLQISKTFGIEGRKLLKPDDDYEALKRVQRGLRGADHRRRGDAVGTPTPAGCRSRPCRPDCGPARSGVQRQGASHARHQGRVLLLPPAAARICSRGKQDGDMPWTEEAGETRWYLYHLDKQAILEEATDIVAAIRCTPETPRRCIIEQATLSEIRGKIEKHIKNTFLKAMQAARTG